MTVAAADSTGTPLSLWLVCGLAFVALLTILVMAVFLPSSRRAAAAKQARLDEIGTYRVLGSSDPRMPDPEPAADPVSALRPAFAHVLTVAKRYVDRSDRRVTVTEQLERAGMRLRPEEWIAMQVCIVIAAAVVGQLLLGVLAAVAGAALGWAGCRLVRQVRTTRRRNAFEAHLADALQLVAASLRAGLALNIAISTVVREGLEPVSSEFGRAMHEVRLGTSIEDALDGVARRTGSEDMTLVVVALRTVREVGGNLAEVLQTTATTMRERAEVRGQVRTLSAEGRFSAKVLVALPLLMAAYLLAFKRTYLHPLYTTGGGIALLVVGGFLLLLGSAWLSRLTRIEV